MKSKRSGGFTLIEVMIVVVIIGILAGLAIPRFMKATTRAKQSEAKMILRQIYVMQQTYRQEYDTYWIPSQTQASAEDPDAFAAIGVEIMPQARYRYSITGDALRFNAEAVAVDLDDDATPDRWRIDQTGQLLALSNDALK